MIASRKQTGRAPVQNRPLIGVLVDTSYKYGASIVLGALRYANIKRRWLIYKQLGLSLDENSQWPRLDAIICAAGPSWILDRALRDCKNVIYCSSTGDPDVCPVVGLDGAEAGMQAAEHLINCGLEHFAFYSGNPRLGPSRLAGFRNVIEARGFACEEIRANPKQLDVEGARRDRLELFQRLNGLPKPVGILAVDDPWALELANACLEANLAVPEQVAIIGINNDDMLCQGAWPPLSSVEGDFSRIGYKAAELLERMLAGEILPREDRENLLPPLGVVQRQSTNTLAVKDENLAKAIQFIREHACDPCTVNDVLFAVPVGRRWLEKLFVLQLGHTPHDEIARVRVETAQRFLRETTLKLTDIAFRCGYSELKRFHLAFRKVTSTTPAAYRRTHRLARDVAR
jgi:LacI family transcriptional regulator